MSDIKQPDQSGPNIVDYLGTMSESDKTEQGNKAFLGAPIPQADSLSPGRLVGTVDGMTWRIDAVNSDGSVVIGYENFENGEPVEATVGVDDIRLIEDLHSQVIGETIMRVYGDPHSSE